MSPTETETSVQDLARLSAERHVLGSAGLSAAPAAHELWLGARRFWTWCSNANFFETREAALSWSAQRKMEGEVIELDEARRGGLAHWGPLLSTNRGIESREDHGDNG
jgi:hypothetical protein